MFDRFFNIPLYFGEILSRYHFLLKPECFAAPKKEKKEKKPADLPNQ